jgi:hypothetical protein
VGAEEEKLTERALGLARKVVEALGISGEDRRS